MQNIKTMKKPISYVVIAVLVALLMPLLSPQVHAALDDFYIDGAQLTSDTGPNYTYDATTETLTITGNVTGDIAYGGITDTGHVVVESGHSVGGDITVNGDVTIKSGATVGSHIRTDGTVTITDGTVNGTVTAAGGLSISDSSARVASVVLTGDTVIDGTNVTCNGQSFPLSAVNDGAVTLGSITIDGDLTVTGAVDNPIYITSSSNTYRYINVNNVGALNRVINLIDVTATVNIDAGGSINAGIQSSAYTQSRDLRVNGDVTGNITVYASAQFTNIYYQSGTLTGDIINNSDNGTVSIYKDAVINGDVDAAQNNGNIEINGTINGNVNSNVLTPTGYVYLYPLGTVSGSTTGTLTKVSGVMANGKHLLFDSYYIPNLAGSISDVPYSTAPTTGGYIRLTFDGTKVTMEINNINAPRGNIHFGLDSLPLDVYVVGSSTLDYITNNEDITLRMATGGQLTSAIEAYNSTFTLENGYLNAPYVNGGHGILASNIVINSGEFQATGTIYALASKPVINIPAGNTLQIMAGAAAPGTAMAESADYHLNPYVHITVAPSPTPAPVPTPVPYNSAISPLTGVYNN